MGDLSAMMMLFVSVPLSGLTSVNDEENVYFYWSYYVSVPLSGLTSVNTIKIRIRYCLRISVSVPLSGLTSVNWDGTAKLWDVEFKFPSPYRG